MKILVTGSNGFTGKALLPFLANQGVDIAGFSREPGAYKTYIGDLLDKDSLTSALREFRPDAIIHLAGIALPSFSNVELMYNINMLGTKNLLDCVVKLDLSLQKLIVASTAHVYGIVDSNLVNETQCPKPMSHYGNSKLAMENIARMYFDKIPIVITRPFNYSGPGQSNDYVLAKIVNHYTSATPEISLGNIDVVRDFSYIDDIVSYYWSLLNSDSLGEYINLCSAKGTSIRQIICYMDQIAGYQIKVHSNSSLLRSQDNPVFVGDNSLLLDKIGNDYKPLTIQQILENMYKNKL